MSVKRIQENRRRGGHVTLCYDGGYGCNQPLYWEDINAAHAAGKDYVHDCGRRIPPYRPRTTDEKS